MRNRVDCMGCTTVCSLDKACTKSHLQKITDKEETPKGKTMKRNKWKNEVKTPLYHKWQRTVSKCHTEGATRYVLYGAKGIKVCERWHDYDLFVEDMGETLTKGMHLVRRDPLGDYTPENCFASKKWQDPRRKRSATLTYKGEELTVEEWAVRLGKNLGTFITRQNRRWSDERIITTE